jgi:TPR repeat protein
MTLTKWKAAAWLLPLIEMICLPQAVLGQTAIREAEPMPSSENGAEFEPNAPGGAFDILARSFSKKKRSELINLKTYTDAEWEAAVNAVAANRKACRKGDAEECLAAGDAYVSGDGVWPVPAIAYILFAEACDAGLGAGCIAFVDLANSGLGFPEGGYEEADGLLEKACNLGDLVGCERFAQELHDSDPGRADAVREQACKAGGAEACASLGDTLLRSGQVKDQSRGAAILDAQCRASGARACQIMAQTLAITPQPDQARINEYSHYACYAGSGSDCADMSDRAFRGVGMARDRDLALSYFDKSCEFETEYCTVAEALRATPQLRADCAAGDQRACAGLGRALSEYESPEKDIAAAFALLEASCRSGIGNACTAAAGLLGSEDTAPQDREGELLDTGCTAGDSAACLYLALLLETNAEPDNLERAVALFARLCDADVPDACAAESRHAGIVPSARITPADERFIAPFESGNGESPLRASTILEVCFTGSERCRGKTYVHFACDRGEKGVGSAPALPGQAPWQALLWRPEVLAGSLLTPAQRVLCGGSLIAQGWVLTAAHCLTDNKTKVADAGHRIRLGVYYSKVDEGISYPILRTIAHPQYDPAGRFVYDIALVQYDHRAGEVGVARVAPIRSITLDPLPAGERKIVKGMEVFSFGWGWTQATRSRSTDHLQIVKMELASESACAAVTRFDPALGNPALCAAGRNREQTCYGDSGGPLVYYADGGRPVLLGVVSAGKECGRTGRPSQYTRVAAVRRWIASHVAGLR